MKFSQHHRGMTLLEIIVVIAMIGIIISIAIPTLVPNTTVNASEKAMNQLQAMMKLATDEAILSDSDVGLVFTPNNGYRFLRWEAETHWVEFIDETFRSRTLPDELEATLSVEGYETEPVTIDEPHIVFFASGLITPFELIARNNHANAEFRILANDNGNIVMHHTQVN